ncbi:hypothetical protein NEUTE1DRAFT_99590 [Neurospora tetrasperma FGSC 2508]|uniref:Uncharacterized protein n=1 Tax=Neurospora tetrasperma (strain FGSC 2508 / ATCC MYA-4615 / P0657) TaxID=510951 RepID=F8MG89_NEUT8|nr:uncharacterized protein NEUTE1DRAFT_99590 [Neurospora tetrasperma FGSC 2508]EGO59415.1 hypothetical protein NEUTE1DRAFT_99590 [Neurospora tetrasperma FGSC 2508]
MASHNHHVSHSCQPPPLGLDGAMPWPGPIYRQPATCPQSPAQPTHTRKAASVKSSGSSISRGRKNIAASVKEFFHSLRPSNCPEQGFTLRHHEHDHGHPTIDEILTGERNTSTAMQPRTTNARRFTTPRQKSVDSDPGEAETRHHDPSTPDTIVSEAWNIPVVLPRRDSNISGKSRVKATPIPVRKITSRLNTRSDDGPKATHHRGDNQISSLDGTWANMGERRVKSGNIPTFSMPSRKPVPTQNRSCLPTSSQAPHVGTADSHNVISSAVPGYNRARSLFLEKQEARRQRRILREAGDYLGVTGANPYTGMLDNITPRTSIDMTEFRHGSPQSCPKGSPRGEEKRRGTGKRTGPRQPSKLSKESEQCQSPSNKSVEPAQAGESATTSHTSNSFLGMETMAVMVPSGGSLASATSFPSNTKSLRLRFHPLIPRRLGPGPMDTGSVPGPTGIKKPFSRIPVPDRCPVSRKMLPGTPMAPVPSSGEVTYPHLDLTNLNPACQWANMLIEDLSGLERSIRDSTREAKAWASSIAQDISGLGQALHIPQPQSACTPIITITGCESSPRRQLPSVIKEICPKGPEAKAPQKARKTSGKKAVKTNQETSESVTVSSSHQTSSLSPSAVPKNGSSTPLDSPPSMQPNVSPKLARPDLHHHHSWTASLTADRVAEMAAEDLARASQDELPKAASAKTSGRVSTPRPREQPGWEMRKTMRKEADIQDPRNGKRRPPLTSTYTRRPSLAKSKSWSSKNQNSVDIKTLMQAMVHGAARAAFTQHPANQRTGSEGIPASASGSDSASTTGQAITGDMKAGEATGAAENATAVELGTSPITSLPEQRNKRHKRHKLKDSAGHGGDDNDGRSRSQDPKSKVSEPQTCQGDGAAASDDLYRLFPGLALPVRSMVAVGSGGPPFEVPVGVRIVVSVVVTFVAQFVCGYWAFVRPVFHLDSPLHKRYARGQATLGDVVVYVFALMFVFFAGAAVVWVIRGTVLVCRLVRAIIGGLAMLAGL